MRVTLVNMPWAAIDFPSLAIGLLRSGLDRTNPEIQVSTIYANLEFVDWITGQTDFAARDYSHYSLRSYFQGHGDWVFSSALYDDTKWRNEEFQKLYGEPLGPEKLPRAPRLHELAPLFIDHVCEMILDTRPDIDDVVQESRELFARGVRLVSLKDAVDLRQPDRPSGPSLDSAARTHQPRHRGELVAHRRSVSRHPGDPGSSVSADHRGGRPDHEQVLDVWRSRFYVGKCGYRQGPGFTTSNGPSSARVSSRSISLSGSRDTSTRCTVSCIHSAVNASGTEARPRTVSSTNAFRVTRAASGVSHVNPMSRRPLAPAEIPTPNYDGFFERLTDSAARDWVEPKLIVEGSRGCWWGEKHHCTFCGLNGSFMEFRGKSPARFEREIMELVEREAVAPAGRRRLTLELSQDPHFVKLRSARFQAPYMSIKCRSQHEHAPSREKEHRRAKAPAAH